MTTRIATITVCVSAVAALGLAQGRSTGSDVATFSTLPAFAGPAEALAVDEAGTIIVGYATDDSGLRHAVEWVLQADGSWAINDLPSPPGATRTQVGGVNNRGDVAGDDFDGNPSNPSLALLWPAGSGPLILNCPTDAAGSIVYAISADAQVVVGNGLLTGENRSTAAVWRPGGVCREDLPLLLAEDSGAAFAVNADGTIVGGGTFDGATGVAVRWTNVAGDWRIEQLDTRSSEVRGANAGGDLAGYVMVRCRSGTVCQRAFVWYTTGASLELGTLGGPDSLGLDINSAGEVVGISMTRGGTNTAFFWSLTVGMVKLPVIRRSARANALSDVRPDGTRLAVGVSQGEPVVWVIRNP
jgi:probable HAF family extracellular repeat protein